MNRPEKHLETENCKHDLGMLTVLSRLKKRSAAYRELYYPPICIPAGREIQNHYIINGMEIDQFTFYKLTDSRLVILYNR